MSNKLFTSTEEILAQLDYVASSPSASGIIKAIMCRPNINERLELQTAELSLETGLVGDNWLSRGSGKPTSGKSLLDVQITIMNARAIEVIAQTRDRWQLAGDQFFVDFDISYNNVPIGSHLQLGEAIVCVTAEPHLGCEKFVQRFGKDAGKFVNSPEGKALNMRGINATVITEGVVKLEDRIQRVS